MGNVYNTRLEKMLYGDLIISNIENMQTNYFC